MRSKWLIFAWGSLLYGLALPQVREVGSIEHLCTLPGLPPYVLGIVHHRGMILSVVDLRIWWGLPMDESKANSLIVLANHERCFGVCATSIVRIETALPVQAATQQSIAAGLAVLGLSSQLLQNYVIDIRNLDTHKQGLILLDAEKLLLAPEMWIDEG